MLNVSKPIYKKYLSFSDEEITATGEIIDIIEGVLIDNYLLQDDDGNYIIFREYPRTTWTSGHEKITGNAADIWSIWDEMTAERETA
ncbi:MAG: hypothetical protein J6X60_06730 [Ruminiclostridium sp.]|nr:hypothetical protein [Ruminiclostridium sp.]